MLVPRELAPGEKRVAATPETVKRLMCKGVSLKVECGAGLAAGFRDDDFAAVGAELRSAAELPWNEADGVLCVNPPPTDVLDLLRPGSLLVGLLAPYGASGLTETLNRRQASAIALELLPRISRAQSMDVLSSQANIAGYKAVLLAAAALDRYVPMLMTAAGTIQPSRVLVLGAGVAGLQAVATAIQTQTGIETQLSTSGGTSGGRFISKICTQLIELGPPNASIHKIDEYIELTDLESSKAIYRGVLENLAAHGKP